jgi:tetratricopeptide (TPR) repeat protein
MQPGDMLGERFEIERRAGSGGMGEVFRARDRTSGTAVAVKVLLSGSALSDARLAREAETLAELSHPGIVRYVAHGVTPSGAPYLAMEWLEGEDLARRLERGALTLSETVALGVRVAGALGAAHERGVVHRDLSPSNLFLVDNDITRVRVLDFGIARQTNRTRVTQSGVVLGTPGYMAPEQARSGQEVDARVDVFALGCVLFECLTGVPVFRGEHFMAIMAKVLFEEAPRLREIGFVVPETFDTLVTLMLAKDPALRPPDGAAVAAELATLGATSTSLPDFGTTTLSGPLAALSGSERRMVSIVLLGNESVAEVGAAQTRSEEELFLSGEASREVVEACGGRLTSLTDGSAIVTIAGAAPVATDQAAQAARCALALRALYPSRPLSLSTGRAEVKGKLPVGDAIDSAARMLTERTVIDSGVAAAARVRLIALDEVTAGLLDARFEMMEDEQGFWLRSEHELMEGARTLLGKETACVGRDWELGTLEAFLKESVDEPRARAVLVTAPAGIGKSRLVHELMRRVRRRGEGIEVWTGRGDSLRAGAPFFLLGQVLRSVFRIQDGESLASRQERIVARVGARPGASPRRQVAAFLGEIVGTPFPDDESALLRAARQNAQLMNEHIRRAFLDFLEAEAVAHPILLVLEDLHWGDLPTVRFVDVALRDLRELPFMVLALARPEVHELFPKLWIPRGVQEIRLKELSSKASRRLVRQVLGDDVSAEVVDRLVAQAEGHAFYLEELIRAVAEGKGEALPATVLSMVQARLAGLPAEARRLLRAASVFGEAFWQSGLAALLGGGTDSSRAHEWISILVEREVLVHRAGSRFPGEEEFMFRHALLREGAYTTLIDEDRVRGHRIAGRWLVQRGESEPLLLAQHFERGQEPARAGGFYLRAAEQALRGSDTDAAMKHARRGLECGATDELKVSLLSLLCEAHGWRSDWTLASIYAEEVQSLSSPGSAPWVTAMFLRFMSALHQGDPGEGTEVLRLLSKVEPVTEAVGMLVLALVTGVSFLDSRGRFDAAEAILLRIGAIMERDRDRDPIAEAWMEGGHGLRNASVKDDPWSGLVHTEAARARFRSVGHTRGDLLMQVFFGMNAWFLGALAKAEDALRGTLIPDEEFSHLASYRPFLLAGVLSDRGALSEARRTAAHLVEVGQAQRIAMVEGRGRWALADVLCRQGDLDDAEREARSALELLSLLPLEQLAVKATLAAILLRKGRAGEALAAAEEATDQARAMGACGFFRGAGVRLVHAEALLAMGEDARARVAIAAARDRLRAIADKITDPELARSFLEDVPENARTLSLARAWVDHRPG